MKKGFTLNEVLITLGIVGVIAALTVPSIMNSRPDDIKIKYLNAYSTLTSLTSEILGDTSYYWIEAYTSSGNPRCAGISCMNYFAQADYNILLNAHPELNTIFQNAGINSYADWTSSNRYRCKLPLILASKMNLQSNPTCDSGDSEFTTTNGITYIFNYAPGQYTVSMDVDQRTDNNGVNNHTFIGDVDSSNLKDVDTFKLVINQYGSVTVDASDTLAAEFLKYSSNMKDTKKERKTALGNYIK